MKTLSLIMTVLVVTVNTAYAAHTKKEHAEEYVESEKRSEIIVNESGVNQRKSTITKDLIRNDSEDATSGLIYSEDDPYKDMDF